MNSPIAVIGAGAWGTTLAMVLHHQGRRVRLWENFPDYAQILVRTRYNPKFLPGVSIPEEILITHQMAVAVEQCREIVLAVPAQVLRSVLQRLVPLAPPVEYIVSAAKGLETQSLSRMSEVIEQAWGSQIAVCALSGPSHAEEVSRGLPCSLVAAAQDETTARHIQKLFMTERLRVYTSRDVIGVELGGALKNIIALATGAVDGLGLGDNAKAALITRGLVEMRRLGVRLGARAETFAGLSGLGDLVVTCTSQHSRNRHVGEELGKGKKLSDILASMEMVVEGIDTARSARVLAEREKVEMPITFQVNRLLFEDLPAAEAVSSLMERPAKAELELGV